MTKSPSLPDWLGLAATPTFMVMALLCVIGETNAYQATCLGTAGTGMALMYGLMALFHLPAWLRLFARSRSPDAIRA